MERLNHQAGLLLKKVTEEADRCAIQEPMSELKMLWDNLDEKIIGRQVRKGNKRYRLNVLYNTKDFVVWCFEMVQDFTRIEKSSFVSLVFTSLKCNHMHLSCLLHL